MEEKNIYTGTSSKGTPYSIRYPKKSDVKEMWRYINELSKEQTFITFQGEEISYDDEEKFVEERLKKIEEKKCVMLLVFNNETLIGISAVDLQIRTQSHEGIFGISVAQKYRGEGIGKTLMKYVLQEAHTLPDLKIISLGVFANNPLATQMYEAFGFKEYGRLPEGLKYKGEFIDHVFMYKKIV